MEKTHEKRGAEREFFSTTFEYTWREESGRERMALGLSTNLSQQGLGLYSDRQMAPGQSITLYCPKLDDAPRDGEVRWCRQYAERLYRVGIVFN